MTADTLMHTEKIPPVAAATTDDGIDPNEYQEGVPLNMQKTDTEGNAITTASGGRPLCADENDCIIFTPLPGQENKPKTPAVGGSTFAPTERIVPQAIEAGPKIFFGPTVAPPERAIQLPAGFEHKPPIGQVFYPTSGAITRNTPK